MNDHPGDTKMNKDIPPCQTDAVRKIRMILINGIPTGIMMLDEIIGEVKEMHLASDQEIRDSLMQKVKMYNYIPKTAENAYLASIFTVYQNSSQE